MKAVDLVYCPVFNTSSGGHFASVFGPKTRKHKTQHSGEQGQNTKTQNTRPAGEAKTQKHSKGPIVDGQVMAVP